MSNARNPRGLDDFDLDGLDVNVDIDTGDIDDAIDEGIDEIDEFDPDTDDFDIDEGDSSIDDSTTITDGDGNELDIHGTCTGVICVCDNGFEGEFCTHDIDECAADDACGDSQDCTNIFGSFICTDQSANPVCPAGYDGIVPDCVDVNECLGDVCGDNQVCGNTIGGYDCSCVDGYELDGDGCVDIDECTDSPCVNAICENGPGSYSCECYQNYVNVPGFNTDECHIQAQYDCFNGENGGCSHFCS